MMETFPLAEYGHNSRERAARHDRGEEARLRRHDPLRRRPELREDPGGRAQSKDIRRDARAAHRRVQGELPRGRRARRRAPIMGTTYLSVVDRDGNMVSLIQSNYATVGFGSGLAVGGAGFVLQNRGGLFTLEAIASERARAAQAAAAHHHSGVHAEGRRAHRASASWAAGTRRRRTRSSCRTSSTSA